MHTKIQKTEMYYTLSKVMILPLKPAHIHSYCLLTPTVTIQTTTKLVCLTENVI